jgi:hypothetical protein
VGHRPPTETNLASPRIFGSSNQPEFDLPPLECRHGVTVDQRDLSAGMFIHSIDASHRDEVTGLDDKLLHRLSIQKGQPAPAGCRLEGRRAVRRAGDRIIFVRVDRGGVADDLAHAIAGVVI